MATGQVQRLWGCEHAPEVGCLLSMHKTWGSVYSTEEVSEGQLMVCERPVQATVSQPVNSQVFWMDLGYPRLSIGSRTLAVYVQSPGFNPQW